MPPASASISNRALAAIAAISLLIAFLVTDRLGASDICGANEAVEAVFVQQMVEHGKLLFPLDNGREPMYKPPLFHWSSVTLDRLRGVARVTPFNLRLTSAIYATAGATIVMVFVLRQLGASAAIMAGLILAASYEYISQGRYGRVDMTLTFFEILALVCFVLWLDTATLSVPLPSYGRGEVRVRQKKVKIPDPKTAALHLALAIALGLAVLAKGPVGALLPGGAIVVFLVLDRRWAELRALLKPLPIVLGGAIASSWYVICLVGRQYGFLNRQLASENLGRFVGSLGRMPVGYYARPLLLNAGPLSLIAPIAVWAALSQPREVQEGSAAADSRAGQTARLFAIFWIVSVIFFQLAAYKRKAYLLPLSPASALLVAWWVYYWAAARLGRWVPRAVAATCALLIVVNFFYIPWREAADCGARLTLAEALRWPLAGRQLYDRVSAREVDSYRRAAAEINRVVGPTDPLMVWGFDESLEPLVFELDRNVSPLTGPLQKSPPGYILVPGAAWARFAGDRAQFTQVLIAPHGRDGLILLRR